MCFILGMNVVANRGSEVNHRHKWLNHYNAPGPVGSVGDVHLQPRLKHSFPDAALRYQREFAHKREQRLGSNVTDGQHVSYDTGAGPSHVLDATFAGTRGFKIAHGYRFQDLRDLDRSTVPIQGSLPQYSWNNKIAETYKSMHTGEKFLPQAGNYTLVDNEVPRGGLYPKVTDIIGTPTAQDESVTRMNYATEGGANSTQLKSHISNPRNPFLVGTQYSKTNAKTGRMGRLRK